MAEQSLEQLEQEFHQIVSGIHPADVVTKGNAQKKWNSIAKPLHSLGKLEDHIMQIAALTGGRAMITACERNKMRADRLRYNIDRQGAPRVTVMNMDARQLDDLFSFDRILLDAPCSGSGTVTEGSHGQFSKDYLDRTVKMQKTLLDKAIRLLKPGHELVYSTCSVFRDENEEVIASALKKGGVSIVPIDDTAFEGMPKLPTTIEGTLCVCPDERYEGFFVAKLKKAGKSKKK